MTDRTQPEPSPREGKRQYSRSMHRLRSHESAHAEQPLPEANIPQHPLIPRNAAELVTTQEGLDALIADLRAAGQFVYDSEFIGELTYRPKLCLIQVATAQRVSLVDPLVELDLSAFWELICDPSILKIVHAGEQDVEPVIRHLGKQPANLFDTQLSAGFVGMPYPISLSKLVQETCGAKLGKGLTFTRWDQRPLSAMQLRYAADDVRYLPCVHDAILKKLQALGHEEWAKEECAALCDASQYVFDPETQYLRVRGASGLPPQGLAVLRELTSWRDQSAREDDLPPRAFLKDEVLMEMARHPVKSIDKLDRVRGLPRPVKGRHGEQLVEMTLKALALPLSQMPQQKSYEPSPTERFRAESLWAAAQAICTAQSIDPALATNHAEVAELDRRLQRNESTADLGIVKGWRGQAVGGPLTEFSHGKRALGFQWEKGAMRLAE